MKVYKLYMWTVLYIAVMVLTLLMAACTTSSEKAVVDPENGVAAIGDQAEAAEEPLIFAEGIVSMPGTTERALTFSPDGTTLLFHRRDNNFPMTYQSWKSEGQWTEPVKVEYASTDDHYESPFFSPDGGTLYYASNRAGEQAGQPAGIYRIWMIEYRDGKWGDSVNPTELNGDGDDAYPSVTRDGTIYFTSNRSGGLGGYDLYRSVFRDGAYTVPVNLGNQINTVGDDYPAYIDPDGEFILLSRGYKMLISYQINGSWTEPVHLALKSDPGNAIEGRAPYLSADRKLLYYERSGDLYQIGWDQLELPDPPAPAGS